MSQVKNILKMENGDKTPAPKQEKKYGNLIINGINLGNSEDLYNAFAQHARNQALNQGEFYDQWLAALRNGQDVEFGNGNTTNIKPEGMSEKRAGRRSGWTRFWDDTFNNRRNIFSDAIATARRFSYSAPGEVKPTKSNYDLSQTLYLDYNKGKDGKYSWSKLSGDNIAAQSRVKDIFKIIRGEDTENEITDKATLKRLTDAYNEASKTGDADVFMQDLWNRVMAKPGYKDVDNDDDLDFLKIFNITAKPYGVSSMDSGNGGSSPKVEKPKPTEFELNGKTYVLVDGKPQLKGGENPTIEEKPDTVIETKDGLLPTLITKKYAVQNGLSDDYIWGLNWNGSNYTLSDLEKDENLALRARMNDVEAINKTPNLSQSERIAKIKELINIPYEDFSVYENWTPDLTFSGLNLGGDLLKGGIKSAAISEYTPTTDGSHIFKYFNNAPNSNLPWGFREPRYLVYGSDGKLSINNDESILLNREVGQLQKPKFIPNLLGQTKELTYREEPYLYPQAPYGMPNPTHSYKKDNFFIKGKKNGEQLVQRVSDGQYFIFVDKTKDLIKISKERALKFKEGGTIDFNKVNTLVAKNGGKIEKAEFGLKFGGANTDSTPIWNSIAEKTLAGLDFASLAWGRNKIHDRIEKGLKDSLQKNITPFLHTVSTATPYEDAMTKRYDEWISRGSVAPKTSDAAINAFNDLTLQEKAIKGRDDAVRQQSLAAFQRQLQNNSILSDQSKLYANTENDFRAKQAGLAMNLANNDASLYTQQAQSWSNLFKEDRVKFDNAKKQYNKVAYETNMQQLADDYDRQWRDTVNSHKDATGAGLYDVWNKMNITEQNKYAGDILTWLEKEHGDIWNSKLKNARDLWQRDYNGKALDLYSKFQMDPLLAPLYRTKYGVELKSGGKVGNRYKNEPWEEIWINQNKSAHKATAKLNDNVIKVFLKTLK